MQEQEQGNDETNITFEIEETTEPTPTTGDRILASLKLLKAYLADLFVNFVILPNSKLMIIKYINCLFVFATTLTITYMVSKTNLRLDSITNPRRCSTKEARAPPTLNSLSGKTLYWKIEPDLRSQYGFCDQLSFRSVELKESWQLEEKASPEKSFNTVE